jgi:HlyD family secretion protein
MIPGTSAMDRPVEKAKGLSRRALLLGVAGMLLLAGAGFAVPSARRWARSERVVDGSRLRIGQVVRGDLERDVSAQGRIVAALHPTLFSPAQGTVTLSVKAGS